MYADAACEEKQQNWFATQSERLASIVGHQLQIEVII